MNHLPLLSPCLNWHHWLNHWLIKSLTHWIDFINLRGVELSQVAAPSGSVCQLSQMWWNDSPAVDQDTKRHSPGLGLGLGETEKNLPPQCLYSVAAPLPLVLAFCWHSLTEHVSVWRSCHCGIPKKTRFRQQWTPEVPSAPAAVVSKAKVASVETSPAGVTWAQTDSHLKTTPSVSQLPGKCWHTHRQTGVQPKPLPLLFLNP